MTYAVKRHLISHYEYDELNKKFSLESEAVLCSPRQSV